MKNIISTITYILPLFILLGSFGLGSLTAKAVSELPQAKNFSLETLDGSKQIALEDFKDKAVVINFWATWCGPCREEMPLLQKEWEKYEGKGVEFVGIDVMDDKNLAAALINEMGITYTNLHDPTGEISNKYGVIALPVTFFINKDGQVAIKNYGPFLGKEGKKKFKLYMEEITE